MGYKKIVQSGTLVETYEYKYDLVIRGRKRAKRRKNGKSIYTRNRRADNLFRLQRNFVRLVRANLVGNKTPLFITLTMFEPVSVRSAYSSFTRFNQRLRYTFGKGFRYVATVEFQKSGNVHFHCLYWGLGVTQRSEKRTRTIQRHWQRGFIDCVSTDGSPRLAFYLAKYMFKSMSDQRLIHQKAYVASRNALRSVSVSSQTAFSYLDEIVGQTVPKRVAKYDTVWFGPCQYKKYELEYSKSG